MFAGELRLTEPCGSLPYTLRGLLWIETSDDPCVMAFRAFLSTLTGGGGDFRLLTIFEQ